MKINLKQTFIIDSETSLKNMVEICRKVAALRPAPKH